MTKEERAKKWFCNVPNADSVSIKTKIDICNKVAKKMAIAFFILFAVECILLFILSGGKIFDLTAGFLNNISKASSTRNHYRGVAITGGLVSLSIVALPLILAFSYKNKCLKSEIGKVAGMTKNNDTHKKSLTDFNKETNEDFLHFYNINFKLAIIQVLMYELELLQPYFDIYDFANQHKEEVIDTDSYTIIEPAINFFKELPIPKKFAPHVEMIYMDGGNDVYMNIIPQWDGEDNCFDLNEITLSELQQFPNFRKATILSSNFDKVKEVFHVANIEVELL